MNIQNLTRKSARHIALVSVVFISMFNVNIASARSDMIASIGTNTIADMVERNLDAVVNISTTRVVEEGGRRLQAPEFPEGSPFGELFKDFFNEESFKGENNDGKKSKRRVNSLGSGFVISKDGYLVTNEHVINGADEITIIFNDGTELIAKVVGADKKVDIALLKVESENDLKFVGFGDDEKLRVGEWVVTIGNPFGFGSSVSAGIVSARGRNINSGPYDDFIQTDAAINKGNSGGPLFNLKGEVVGVNAAIVSPSGGNVGIGFSIPASTVMPVIAQLKEFGETRRGWLGVVIQNVTDDIAESIGMDEARGAFVAKVFKDSPAEDAGVKAQDVIIKFNNQDVPTQADLPKIVANTEINKDVTIVVIRDGKELELEVKVGLLKEGEKKALAEVNAEKPKSDVQTILGIELQELSEAIIEEFKLDPETKGLLIVGVEGDSAAAEKMLRPGDRILEASRNEVNTYEQLRDIIKQTKDKDRSKILLLVEQPNGSVRFVALPIK